VAKSADAFRTISEVAEWLDTPAHVLRFWESRFTQVKPVKRAGGRRYYRPTDMLLLGGIKKLLHEDGMTIKGAQKLLRTDGVKKVSGLSQPLDTQNSVSIDIEPVDAAVKLAKEPSPPLSIIEADEAEIVSVSAPEVSSNLEPEVAADPEPAVSPVPDLVPSIETEQEATLPEAVVPPFIPATEIFEAPQADLATQTSAPDTPNTADTNAQLSSIYSRLTALHDRMKANIDPKRQG